MLTSELNKKLNATEQNNNINNNENQATNKYLKKRKRERYKLKGENSFGINSFKVISNVYVLINSTVQSNSFQIVWSWAI